MNNASDITHQLVLRYVVEELFKVNIHYPSAILVKIFEQLSDCLLAASFRSETVAVVAE